MKRYLWAALILMMFLLPAMTVGAEESIKDKKIGPNNHYGDWILGASKDDEIKINFTSDSNVDLFIMASDEYASGLGTKYPINFTPSYQVLNTTSAKFTWTVPDSQSYYFVVDNEVNSISGSANPTGNVTFSYTRSDPLQKQLEALGSAISTFCIAVGAVLVIIVILIIVIIVIMARKKKAQPPQPFAPGPQYGQPQYGQPQYGQPPQQYNQPPPGQYQPPPPPPGSPPS